MNYRTKGILGLSILGILLLLFVFGNFVCRFDSLSTRLTERNMPPTSLHWFGTDELGRDLFARTLQGMRISLSIGILAATIDIVLGTLWGAIAAFYGGIIERIMMRCAELLYSVPYLLFVILASALIGTGIVPILVSMLCVGWIQMARIVRVLVKEARCSEYVVAAYALGFPQSRIFFAHILPNVIGPILAACMLSVPYAIFTEAFLSFLGIGIQPPIASLGSMVSDAIPAMRYYPWRLLFPASFISFLIFGVMLLSDSLRDYYDPKQRILTRNTT
jgi:oligopeptide transport system permease protein